MILEVSRLIRKEDLIAFEQWCVDAYHDRKIKSPVHLSGGNEDQLIEIFKDVKTQDWVFTTYRSHYHALLKGVDPAWLKQWILENKSIHVMNKEHRIVSSAIVGGTLSQAVGCAMAIYEKDQNHDYEDSSFDGEDEKLVNHVPHVWVFCGDMTASLGVFEDCRRYSCYNDLPITFVVEDNGLSTDTPTKEAWGFKKELFPYPDVPEGAELILVKFPDSKIIAHRYKRVFPHYGTGKRINFDEPEVKT